MADKKRIKALKEETISRLNISDAQIEALSLQVEKFFYKYMDQVAALVRSSDEREVTEVARALTQFQNALKQAGGFDSVLKRIERIYGDELESIQKQLEKTSGKAVPVSAIDVANVQALVNDQISRAARLFEQHVGDVRTMIISSTIAGIDPNIVAMRDDFGGRLASRLNTEITTSLSGYSRAVNQQKAAELGLDHFIYLGPDDDITREFCQERVDRIFTQEEIDSWDNGTDLPANIYCGGYNCRHQLRPISAEFASELNDD